MESIASTGTGPAPRPKQLSARRIKVEGVRREHVARALRYRERAMRALQDGDEAKAAKLTARAGHQESLAARRAAQVRALDAAAGRAAVVRRIEKRLKAERAAKRAKEREERKATAKAERAAAQEAARAADKAQDLEDVGIVAAPGTAAAGREMYVTSERGKSAKRASILDYSRMIARYADRTPERIAAVQRIDMLWHAANAGLMPAPSFEKGVDVSMRPGGMVGHRSETLAEMERLKAHVGAAGFERLKARIIDGFSFAFMASTGMGDPEHLGIMFRADVDAVARFYGFVKKEGEGC